MTPEELITELNSLGAKFHLEGEHIRSEKGRCPICELCFLKTNKEYSNEDYEKAARKLNLQYPILAACAADNTTYYTYNPFYTKRLLRNIMLKELVK